MIFYGHAHGWVARNPAALGGGQQQGAGHIAPHPVGGISDPAFFQRHHLGAADAGKALIQQLGQIVASAQYSGMQVTHKKRHGLWHKKAVEPHLVYHAIGRGKIARKPHRLPSYNRQKHFIAVFYNQQPHIGKVFAQVIFLQRTFKHGNDRVAQLAGVRNHLARIRREQHPTNTRGNSRPKLCPASPIWRNIHAEMNIGPTGAQNIQRFLPVSHNNFNRTAHLFAPQPPQVYHQPYGLPRF